jgi:periplasmic protein TonB
MTMTGLWQTVAGFRHSREETAAPAFAHRFVVPADIVPVKRRSPIRIRKRTPWRQRPEGEPVVCGGDRMWFNGRLFVEPETARARASCTASAFVHAGLFSVLLGLLLVHPNTPVRVGLGQSLVMPAMTVMVPIAEMPSQAPPAPQRPLPDARPTHAADTAAAAQAATPAPIEAPSSVEPETGLESDEDETGTGLPGNGGGGGGGPDGAISLGPPSSGPLRLGGGIQAPRKIKEAKPVYPQAALGLQTRGTVVLDATIGTDGKVTNIVVLQSIPSLDQAALEAVRQWEYEPATLNGVRVAVVMTILVRFAVQ